MAEELLIPDVDVMVPPDTRFAHFIVELEGHGWDAEVVFIDADGNELTERVKFPGFFVPISAKVVRKGEATGLAIVGKRGVMPLMFPKPVYRGDVLTTEVRIR